jgi:hypothetical protein
MILFFVYLDDLGVEKIGGNDLEGDFSGRS